MEKSNNFNALKEVARDILWFLFILFIIMFPFGLVWCCMWLQEIFS